jgi:hypothetical protein
MDSASTEYRVAYLLMLEYPNEDHENMVRVPKAVFHSLEAAYQRMEEESKEIDPDNRIRKPFSTQELEALRLSKGYHFEGEKTGDWKGLYVMRVEMGDECARESGSESRE